MKRKCGGFHVDSGRESVVVKPAGGRFCSVCCFLSCLFIIPLLSDLRSFLRFGVEKLWMFVCIDVCMLSLVEQRRVGLVGQGEARGVYT